MSNITNATLNWCLASGKEESDGWDSNHCAYEHGLWIFAQLILWFAYCCGYLSTVWNIRRYRWVGVMRFGIFFYALMMCIWAGEIADAMDQLAYSIIILVVNFAHMVYIAYHERPITLNDYLHNLWHKVFNMNGYNLELLDFYNLMQEKAFLKTYKDGQIYIAEGDIPTQLSILLSGKMHIFKRDDWQRKSLYMAHHTTQYERASSSQTAQDAFVGCVYPYEFIDSYEWLMSQGEFKYETTAISGGTSQVTIRVPQYNSSASAEEPSRDKTHPVEEGVTECVVLTWKNEMLEAIFKEHPRLRVCIHSLVGKDIADKMLRITGHSTDTVMPDVDMVRRAHHPFRPTLRADVRNAHQTELERDVLPVPSKRAAKVFGEKFKQGSEGNSTQANLSETQSETLARLGAGPWCELSSEELAKDIWTTDPKKCTPVEEHAQLQAMHSLQRSRLRVTNSRLLGMNPGALETLQPASDNAETNILGPKLLQYFDMQIPELKKKDLYEILKWGRWREYYRPGTVLVRQGEEAHYVGLVLQGRLALYTEDEITRSKSLVTFVDKYDLVGSEDFSSKFRTARRTIQMPVYDKLDGNEDEMQPQDWLNYTKTLSQQLPKDIFDMEISAEKNNRDMSRMYKKMPYMDAQNNWLDDNKRPEWCYMDDSAKEYLKSQIDAARKTERENAEVTVTTIPTIMFMWDIKDLKRLMLADPHVESALSTLLRSDITYKLNTAAPSALGTRLCGVPTQARGDQDIRMCALTNE